MALFGMYSDVLLMCLMMSEGVKNKEKNGIVEGVDGFCVWQGEC